MTPLQYIAANKIVIGNYYAPSIGSAPNQVVGIKKSTSQTSIYKGEYAVVFDDGRTHPICHDWSWVPCEKPQPKVYIAVDINEGKKRP